MIRGAMFWNRKKPRSVRTEPRDHHYVFAHYTVREVCEQDPLQFFSIVASPEQPKFLAWLWELTAKRTGTPLSEVDTAALSVTTGRVKDCPAIIFKMPPPEASAEAHFVAVVLTSSPEPGGAGGEASRAQFRYFTLEYGKNFDGAARTVMCEWADGAHRNFGDGPAATIEDLIGAVERLI
jgi:hypothetical protein